MLYHFPSQIIEVKYIRGDDAYSNWNIQSS